MKTKEQHMDEIFGITGASELIRTGGIDALATALQEAGVAKKALETTDATVEEAVEKDAVDYTPMFAEIVDAQADQAVEMDALKVAQETRIKEHNDKVLKLEAQVTAFQKDMNDLREELSLTSKRASEDATTKLSGADEREIAAVTTKDTPEQYDPFFGELKVPMKQGGIS